jgi:hypothetical protein
MADAVAVLTIFQQHFPKHGHHGVRW